MNEQPQKKYIGDYIKEFTTNLGVKSCIPCQARQQKMNQAHQNLLTKISALRQRFSPGS
jgi:hypothetical protein